jgi:hypothetical protein
MGEIRMLWGKELKALTESVRLTCFVFLKLLVIADAMVLA